MPNGYRLKSLLLPLALLLVSCDDSETTRPEPQDQPEVVARWGEQELRGLDDTPKDMLLAPDGRQLYIVPSRMDTPHLIVLDRETGTTSRWELPASQGARPIAIAGFPSGDILCVLFGGVRPVVALYSGTRQLLRSWSITIESDDSSYPNVRGIAYNALTDEVAVSDLSGHRLLIYRLDGSLRTTAKVGEPPDFGNSGWFRIGALPSGDYLINTSRGGEADVYRVSRDGLDLALWKGDEDLGLSLLRVGRDGNVYLDAFYRIGVHRRSPTGELLSELTYEELDPLVGQIGPVDATASGEIIIGDSGYPAVHDYSASGRYLKTSYLHHPAADVVGYVLDIAAGPEGVIYAADPGYKRVIKTSASSGTVQTWGGPGSTESHLRSPEQILALADGTIYVLDAGRGELRRYTSDGVLMHAEPHFSGRMLAAGGEWIYYSTYENDIYRRQLAAGSSAPWEPLPKLWKANLDGYIQSIDADPTGRLYMLDPIFPKVLVLEPDGKYFRTQRLRPASATYLVDFAVDGAGRIFYLARSQSQEFFVVHDEQGQVVASWSEERSGVTTAMDVDATGELYLARYYGEFVAYAAIP